MADNPSLEPLTPEAIADAYGDAILRAADETKLPEATFPASCAWSYDEMIDPNFWPE